MAGQRPELFQRFLDEVRRYVRLADEFGYASYGHAEHHLQIEGFEITNHPGMFSLFVGQNSTRLKSGVFGYVLPTHNPVRAAEEIATLDHMLQGRLLVGFARGYQARWVDSYAAVPGVSATTPDLAKARDTQDSLNRSIFEEAIRVVKTAWASETFSFAGDFWTFPPEAGSAGHPAYAAFGKGMDETGRVREIGIAPRCYQDPHPPLYGAFAHSMRTIRMWAREGGKPIVLANDLGFCEALWKQYREAAIEAGRDVPEEDTAAWGGLVILADTADDRDRIRAQHEWFCANWSTPFGQGMPNVIMGTSDDICRQIENAYERLGFNEVWLQFSQGLLDPGENEEILYRLATEVIPRFATKDDVGTYV